jgi:hypothetical protein
VVRIRTGCLYQRCPLLTLHPLSAGSMALNRMNAAKGAALSLLNEAYKGRDKISLITFQGDRAQVRQQGN